MIYLFCSAATALYKKDALETLCYPSNHIFRFRYDCRYIQPEMCQKPHSYEGKIGLLVFADTVGYHGTMDFDFLPIRLITTIRLTPIASAIYVDFRLGDFVNYGPGQEKRTSWDHFLKVLTNRPWPLPDKSGRPSDQQGYFLLSADSEPQELTRGGSIPHEGWQTVVQSLDSTKDLAGSTFYLILGFHLVKRQWWTGQYEEILLPSTDKGLDSIYSVPMGTSVVLKILLSRPWFDYANRESRRRLKITAGGEAFSGLSKDTVFSESRYNEDRTVLVCRRVFDAALAVVSIHEPDEPGVRTPRATLLVEVKVPRWIVGAVVSGVVISTLLLAMDAETIRFLSMFLPQSWASTLGCNSRTVATIAKGLSPVPVGISAYLAFRRLPIR